MWSWVQKQPQWLDQTRQMPWRRSSAHPACETQQVRSGGEGLDESKPKPPMTADEGGARAPVGGI